MPCTCSRIGAAAFLVVIGAAAGPTLAQQPAAKSIVVAATSEKPASESVAKDMQQLSPEQKMQRRFPQPARAGDLIGLPLLDDDDRTIGRVKFVARSQAGKLQLIVAHGGFLGWRQRLVAVPIEVVAIAGRQIAALDMTAEEIAKLANWDASLATLVAPDDVIRIALYKR
jgi:hypothetical protein